MKSFLFHIDDGCGRRRMSRMFQSVKLFVLSCLFLTVQSQIGKILPPQNLTLTWLSDFKPELTWQPPQPSMTRCKYVVSTETTAQARWRKYINQTSPWTTDFIEMEGGNILLSVEANCGDNVSEPAIINVTYPELVQNLKCTIHSHEHTRCSWQPGAHVPDLRFYYQLVTVGADDNNNDSLTLQGCSSYSFTNDVRTGCNLQVACNQEIYILFNGTQSDRLVRNTFYRWLIGRPPPPKWTVHEIGSKFNISWKRPDICDNLFTWMFIISYTECNVSKTIQTRETSLLLQRMLHCPYCMTIKAHSSDGGGTPLSEEKCFDPRADSDVLVYAAVIIPLTFACLAALAFVYCRKNKDKFFPKVPQPRDLLSDISDNNNKSTVHNLYIPTEEEENCKITLVIDPLINKPEC